MLDREITCLACFNNRSDAEIYLRKLKNIIGEDSSYKIRYIENNKYMIFAAGDYSYSYSIEETVDELSYLQNLN